MPNILTLWEQWLLELLCRIQQSFGLQCPTPTTPSQAISQIDEAYQQNGAPTFPSPEAQEEFLEVLAATLAHLELEDNDLDTLDHELLTETIENLQKDLSGSK